MKLTFKEACSAVADLFEAAPETWTSGWEARDDGGKRVNVDDPSACCWCAYGGLHLVMGEGITAETNLRPIAVSLGYNNPNSALIPPAQANDVGGRLVAIRMLRMAAGEL